MAYYPSESQCYVCALQSYIKVKGLETLKKYNSAEQNLNCRETDHVRTKF